MKGVGLLVVRPTCRYALSVAGGVGLASALSGDELAVGRTQ